MAEPFLLAIESSAARASVALGQCGRIVRSAEVAAGGRQSEVLMGPLREVLKPNADERIALVIVGTGPGSYNGARVGIAAGQGVALVHGCPAVGVCSLEAVEDVRTGRRCLALGDARRGTFFSLELEDGRLSGEPELLAHDRFLRRVEEAGGAGAALVTLEDPARLELPEPLAGCVARVSPSAPLLIEAWLAKRNGERQTLLTVPPEPFYLRPPHITPPRGAK